MSSKSLPHLILHLVSNRRGPARAFKHLVSDVKELLKESLHSAHREMNCSRTESVRKNAKNLHYLYGNRGLASRVAKIVSDGPKDERTRLQKLASMIVDSLKHVLGVLRASKHELADRLERMAGIGLLQSSLSAPTT